MIKSSKILGISGFSGSIGSTASYSEKIYNALKDQNKDVKLTIYDGVGHNSWDLTYDNQEIYDWLLSKENSGENDKLRNVG